MLYEYILVSGGVRVQTGPGEVHDGLHSGLHSDITLFRGLQGIERS